jgi:hypothetical protein
MSTLGNLANTGLVNYVSFCFLFFVLKFKYYPENGLVWMIAFLVLSFVVQLIINIYLTSLPELCGQTDFNLAIYATAIPWLAIFLLFILCLGIFPGWLRLFSNTFGSSAAYMYGLKETMDKIFTVENRSDAERDQTNFQLLKALDSLYSDQDTLIHELDTRDVFFNEKGEIVWKSFTGTLKMLLLTAEIEQSTLKELYYSLLLKDNVAYFVWFMLIGIMSVLVSTNTLLNEGCSSKRGGAFDIIFNRT